MMTTSLTIARRLLTLAVVTLGALVLVAGTASAANTREEIRFDFFTDNPCNGDLILASGTLRSESKFSDARQEIRARIDADGTGLFTGDRYRIDIRERQRFQFDGSEFRFEGRFRVDNKDDGPDFEAKFVFRVKDGVVVADVSEQRCRG